MKISALSNTRIFIGELYENFTPVYVFYKISIHRFRKTKKLDSDRSKTWDFFVYFKRDKKFVKGRRTQNITCPQLFHLCLVVPRY